MKLTLSAIKSLFRKYDRKLQRGIDGVKAYVDESAADWNQSDETAPDYIKNRTHYEYTEKNKVIEKTFTAERYFDEEGYRCKFGDEFVSAYDGNHGDTVLVVFDGVEYHCKQIGQYGDGSTANGYVIGNTALLEKASAGSEGVGQTPIVDTGEPFLYWSQNYYSRSCGVICLDGNEHTIEVYAFEKKAKPIDDKFLPEDLARKTPVFASYWSNVDTGEHKIGEIDPNTPSVVIPMTMKRFYELTRGHEEFIVRHDRKTIRFGAHLSSVSIGNSAELKNDGNVQLTTYYINHSDLILGQKGVTVVDMDELPESLPNPHPLTFTGAVEATYDGSTPVTVEIPMGGGGSENLNVRLVASVTIDPENPPESIIIDRDNDGNPFDLRKVLIFSDLKSNVSYTHFTINGAPWSYGLRIKHGAAGVSTAYFADDFMYCACDGWITGQIVGYKTAAGGVANENYFGSAKSFQFLPEQGYSGGTFIYIFEVL